MNLAPHSYKNVLSSNPPIVCFVSVGQKDSLRNVQAMEDFVYNIAGAELLDAINISSANLPPDESAFDWTGLTPAAPTPATTWLWGEVERIHLAERVMTGDRVDPAKLRLVGRLSGSMYSLQGDPVSLKRPPTTRVFSKGA